MQETVVVAAAADVTVVVVEIVLFRNDSINFLEKVDSIPKTVTTDFVG